MHRIYLQCVDSSEASQEELDAAGITEEQLPISYDSEQQPFRWRMMAHQAATVHALRSGDAPIIINRAMTGDGKTFAGQFMLFNEKLPTFAMYPTNELARDQQRSLDRTLADWLPPAWPHKPSYQPLNAAELDKLQAEVENTSRMESLELLLSNNDAILTNPDIFHLAMQFAYKQYGAAGDIILGHLAHSFRLFVFDEFHLFGTPQIASVLIALLLMQEITKGAQPARFLFLSATPQKDQSKEEDQLTFLVKKAGLAIETIFGDYLHGASERLPGWRRILQQAALTLYSGRLEAWVDEHLDDVILRFFNEHRPGAKGVIIANGVATANRIYRKLQAPCAQAGVRLAPNTGITPQSERGTTDNYDLIVATSTVDVGVDFRINLLIFESSDAASHTQRLGRLGRHETDRDGTPFETFEAHALLPDWVVEAVKAKYSVESRVSRKDYQETVRESFTPPQAFQHYTEKWAGVQAQSVLSQLRKREIKTQYEEIVPALKQQYKLLFPNGYPLYKRLLEDQQGRVLNAAQSFRGGSPFTALMYDPHTRTQEVVSYSLVTLLRDTELDAMEIDEILRRAERLGQKNVEVLKKSEPLVAYKLLDWLPKPRTVQIYVNRSLHEEQLDVVTEMTGFHFDVPGIPELHHLNRTLERKSLAVLLLRAQDPDAVRKRLKLGYQLELFKFSSANGISGCAAFGRHALLLDSAWYRSKKSTGNDPFLL